MYWAFLCLLFTQIRHAAGTRGILNAQSFSSHTEQSEVCITTLRVEWTVPELLTDVKLVLVF